MIIGIDIRPLMDKEPSGVSLLLFNLLDNLFKIDRHNQYKLFYNSFHSIKDHLPSWNYPNVKFYGFRRPNKLLTVGFLFLKRPYIDRMIGGCDLFIVPNLCFFSLSPKCKKMVIVHDLSFEIYPEFFNVKWRFAYWLAKAKKVFSQADTLIAVSENTKNDLVREYGVEEDRVSVIYPGVEIQNSKAQVLGLKSQDQNLGFKLPENFILTLGTREPRKNLLGVLQAYEKIREKGIKDGLVIAGGGGWLNQPVNDFIAESKYRDNIKVVGYVSESMKNFLYQKASVFLYPSFYEGFGFPPLEAMQNNCPVIAAANSSMVEICQDNAVLVDSYNIGQLVAAIMEINNWSADFKEHFLERAYSRASEFQWSIAAESLKNLIKKHENID